MLEPVNVSLLDERRRAAIVERSCDFLETYGFGMPVDLPSWRPATMEGVRVRRSFGGASHPAYVAQTCVDATYHVLDRDGDVWMSSSILELESHARHLALASGRVVVCGLGLGMIVHAMSCKEEVERILVAERDPRVVALFHATSGFEGWPGRDKVEIVEADVLSEGFAALAAARGFATPDYLYVDIWPDYPAGDAPAEAAVVCAALEPSTAGWWTQELHLGLHCEEGGHGLGKDSFEAYFAGLDVPVPFDDGYLLFCRDVCEAHGVVFEPVPAPLQRSLT